MRQLHRALLRWTRGGEDAEWCLQRFLRLYRKTPHDATGLAPSEMLVRWAYSEGCVVRLPQPGEKGTATSVMRKGEITCDSGKYDNVALHDLVKGG